MNKQLYLALDFDGVLNSAKFIQDYLDQFQAPSDKTYYITEHIDPVAVSRVNQIVLIAGAKVVISTAWRKAFNLDSIRDILESKGFVGEIVGETPVLHCDRGLEVQAWMDYNGVTADQMVILDDLDTMLHLRPRQVLTNFDTGLTDEHVTEALYLFGINTSDYLHEFCEGCGQMNLHCSGLTEDCGQ